jgi:hypothetical protein
VSATVTRAPRAASQRAIDMPVSPNPSTRTFLPSNSSIFHRNFSVDNPTSTSIIVMIQKHGLVVVSA